MAGIPGSGNRAVTFLVSAGAVFEIIAAFCSSPQTAEINAHTRAETLMKWVNIGLLVAFLFVIIAMMMDEEKWPTLLGGGLAGTVLYVAYKYAKTEGLKSPEPGTEQTGQTNPDQGWFGTAA
jgi:L-asparagine transporter-like permease